MDKNKRNKGDPWFFAICEAMESNIGRGWKRQLADKVGVSESNVQVWLKSGRVPAAVRRAIELSDEVGRLGEELSKCERLTNSRWITEESFRGEARYGVQELNTDTGRARLIASGISKLEDAHEIAGIPEIKLLVKQVSDHFLLEEQVDNEQDQELLDSLESWPGKTFWEEKSSWRPVKTSD